MGNCADRTSTCKYNSSSRCAPSCWSVLLSPWMASLLHASVFRCLLYRVTVDMRQHCTDGSFRFCRWRAHTEAWSEDSGPAALSTHGPYVALQVFYAILQPIASELSAHCCRTITMTRYNKAV